jgi:hypothetical protein
MVWRFLKKLKIPYDSAIPKESQIHEVIYIWTINRSRE